MQKVSCIIPAYNEEKGILNVLSAVNGHPLIDEIIVVDDGSTDSTRDIVRGFSSVKLIEHKTNRGKSKAVCTGIKASSGEILLFLDADLVGLTAQNISDLIDPVLSGKVIMSISLRKVSPVIDFLYEKITGLDHIAGERVYPRSIIIDHLDKIEHLPNFGLETYLNGLVVKNKYFIRIVSWKNVSTPLKIEKRGRIAGLKSDHEMMHDIFKTASAFQIFKQVLVMRKLKKFNLQKVSLVICAYNEEKYIGTCLDNAIKSSHGLFKEIIVVDNASTDNTSIIASSFPLVKVVKEEKKGITQARQRGFIEASGEIIAYIDADTKMPDGWVQKVMAVFNEAGVAGLSGRYIYYDISKIKQFFVWIYWYIFAVPTYFFVGYMIVGGNFAIRKDVLQKMNGFDTTIVFYGEDSNIARRASKFGKVKFIPSLAMATSGRRLENQGVINTAMVYVSNFFSEVLLHRPVTKEYKDYR